ncbi:MAG: hypothetical protein PHI66_01170 [Candidatus Pacebacteria bacterium]|nr:hypothetical protein [Candidatus Paceibacterota bacterium]
MQNQSILPIDALMALRQLAYLRGIAQGTSYLASLSEEFIPDLTLVKECKERGEDNVLVGANLLIDEELK